jgi:hypothetical protein
MNPAVDAVLVFPPPWPLLFPYLSLPALTAFLRQRGHSVHQIDANAAAYAHLLSEPQLRSVERLLARKLADHQNGKSPVSEAQADQIQEVLFAADFVIERLARSMANLRDPNRLDDVTAYNADFKVLESALTMVSLPYAPRGFSEFSEFVLGLDDVFSPGIEDPEANIFHDVMLRRIVPRILEARPRLVGISVIFASQFFPALTLARLLRRAGFEGHLTFGGPIVFEKATLLSQDGRIFDWVDSLVLGEGEIPLDALTTAVRQGADIETVPGLMFRRHGELKSTPMAPPIDMDQLPPPDFDGLPLESYLAPRLILPHMTSRGCYWSRCAFCDRSFYGKAYRMRKAKLVAEDLAHLQRKYGASHFSFTDEAIAPRTLRDLSAEITRQGISVKWTSMSILEKQFGDSDFCARLKAAGCDMLRFGMESASQRVLDLMDKGVRACNLRPLFGRLNEAGIAVHVTVIIGFPKETEADRQETLDFLAANADRIESVTLNHFQVYELSAVYQHAERFGLTVYQPQKGHELNSIHLYKVSEGGMSVRDFEQLVGRIETDTRIRPLLRPLFDSVGVHSAIFRRKSDVRRDSPLVRLRDLPNTLPRLLLNDFVFLKNETMRDEPGRVFVHNFATDRTVRTSQQGAQLLRFCREGVSLDDLLAQLRPDSRDRVESYLDTMVSAGVLVVSDDRTT